MKKTVLLGCFMAAALISCKEESALDIVNKSLEFHGGLEAWKAVDALTYQKEEWLYFDNDSLESYTNRTYTHPLTEVEPISMTWTMADTLYKVQNDGQGVLANFPLTEDEKAAFESSLKAAPYTLCQPYKLLADADMLVRLPDDKLEDTPVYTVAIDYINEDGSPGNSWKYYFNKENYRMEGAFVKHGTTYAYVRNLEYETTTGLSLNAKRISYRVDSLRNIQYVRGRYTYTYK